MRKKQKNRPKASIKQKGITTKYGFARWHVVFIAAIAFLLYANTLGHEYTQDDAIVITENMYTQEGISGIPGLLSKDTFFGFFKVEGKEQLVAGGRYRPLTPIMFAIEYQIFGENPFIGHLVNILLYMALGVVIYLLLMKIFSQWIDPQKIAFFALIIALLYIAHPVHTEVVANIKGRDELMAMLLSCISLFILFRNNKNPEIKDHLLAGIAFFLAMMSKENGITLIPVVFLISFLLLNRSVKHSAISMIPFITAALIFIVIRMAVIGSGIGDPPLELMNNPFVKVVNGQYVFFDMTEKLATITYTMGKYIQLLIFPHPLTNDYYPRHIEIMQWGDYRVILSLILYLFIMGSLLFFWKRNKVVAFAAFFFLATISIYSNILFPIGTNMSERFLFMPSLAFCLLLGYGLSNIYYKFTPYITYTLLAIIILLYGYKTIDRNVAWKNDYTLYTTDVKTSRNSAKALNAAGGVLSTTASKENNEVKKNSMLQEAIGYLQKAVEIHPNYKNAWLLLGNSQYYQKNYDASIRGYEQALNIDPSFPDANKNLDIVLAEAGRYAGEKENNIPKARKYLLQAYQRNPNDVEVNRLLGIAEGVSGNHQQAVSYFSRIVELQPNNALGYRLLYQAYQQLGDVEEANKYRIKALEIDPNAFK